MVNHSTIITQANNHLNSLNIKKTTFEIQVLAWDRHKNVAGLIG